MADLGGAARMPPQATIFDLLDESMNEHAIYIGTILFCHLIVEQVLYELLAHAHAQRSEPLTASEKLSFAQKIDRCTRTYIAVDGRSRPILSPKLAAALRMLNDLRNKMAHTYKVIPSYEQVHSIVRALGDAGIDFTDNFDATPVVAGSYGYDELGMLEESVKHLLLDLGFVLLEAGGPNIIS